MKRPSVIPREPVVCDFCGSVYLMPCHGENERCMNRRWAIERGREPLPPKKSAQAAPASLPASSIEDLL